LIILEIFSNILKCFEILYFFFMQCYKRQDLSHWVLFFHPPSSYGWMDGCMDAEIFSVLQTYKVSMDKAWEFNSIQFSNTFLWHHFCGGAIEESLLPSIPSEFTFIRIASRPHSDACKTRVCVTHVRGKKVGGL
jgi:hypothetical protein